MELPEIDELADRLVSLVAQGRAGIGIDADELVSAAFDLGRWNDLSQEPRLPTCIELLREAVAAIRTDRLEYLAYELEDLASRHTGPAGFYSMASVLAPRSGFEFMAALVDHRVDTTDLDDLLLRIGGDGIDFPDQLPNGVPSSHWWWTFDGIHAEQRRSADQE